MSNLVSRAKYILIIFHLSIAYSILWFSHLLALNSMVLNIIPVGSSHIKKVDFLTEIPWEAKILKKGEIAHIATAKTTAFEKHYKKVVRNYHTKKFVKKFENCFRKLYFLRQLHKNEIPHHSMDYIFDSTSFIWCVLYTNVSILFFLFSSLKYQ